MMVMKKAENVLIGWNWLIMEVVNNTTFELFLAMEYELRKHIHQGVSLNLENIASTIRDNEMCNSCGQC